MTISSSADISQSLPFIIAMIQVMVPEVAKGLEERLSKGKSPEAILAEIIDSAQETPEGRGLAHLVSAIHNLRRSQYGAVLENCEEAQKAWPDGSSIIQFIRAHALSFLHRHDEAFAAFEASYAGLWPLFDSPEAFAIATKHDVEEWKEDFYKRWTLSALTQGLEGLLTLSLSDLEGGGEKVVAVLRRARENKQEDAVWSVIAQVAKSLPPEAQDQIAEFGDFVTLLAIADPFEGLEAVAKRISKVWPKDVDCVEAVREQRR
jgi:hypothetical protein